MTIGRGLLTKAETVMVVAIEAGVPALVEAREIIAQFHLMIRRKVEGGACPMDRARPREFQRFIRQWRRDG